MRKTNIFFSHFEGTRGEKKLNISHPRHLFSPSESVDDSDTTSVNTVEFVPDQVRSVKEKARMIAQQQEEIVRR